MNILALHGFTQRGSMWAEVAALAGGHWVTPDLPGHGDEPAVDWDGAAAAIAGRLARMPAPRCLIGYSMGGRLALAAALADPEVLDRLVLASAGPGIAPEEERRRRQAEDGALAAHLESVGMPSFTREWLARPLFAGLARRSDEWRAADLAARAANSAEGVAGALRRLGQGSQPYLGGRLAELAMPVLLVAGEGDAKYLAVAREMAAQIPRAVLVELAGAGHSVVGERPVEFAAALAFWLAG